MLEQLFCQGLLLLREPTLKQPVPEGLHPVGRTHTAAVHEELHPMGRMRAGVVCEDLQPMGRTHRKESSP